MIDSSKLNYLFYNMITNSKLQPLNQLNSVQDEILKNIQHLNLKNQKLITISEAMQNTSFFSSYKVPAIIQEVERSMRLLLDNLSKNLNSFYTHLDQQLKILSVKMQKNCFHHTRDFLHQPRDILQNLVVKVRDLETNLQKTQSNEKRLLQIICQYHKKQIFSEQKTLTQQNTTFEKHNNLVKGQTNNSSKLGPQIKDSKAMIKLNSSQNLKILSSRQVTEVSQKSPPSCSFMKLYSDKSISNLNQNELNRQQISSYKFISNDFRRRESLDNTSHRFKFLIKNLNKNTHQ